MSRKAGTLTPKLRHHKASNTAFVELCGRRVYICKWDNPDRDARYHDILSQWERAGRRYPFDTPLTEPEPTQTDISVAEVCAQFYAYAQGYYVHKDGTPTNQINRVLSAMRGTQELFGDIPAVEFGPLKLAAVRNRWITQGLARSSINSMVGVVKLCFKWASSKELIPASVHQNLATLSGLKLGRSEAKETEPVRPVLEAHVQAIKPFVNRQVWTMIELQLLTAARPGEIVQLRNDGTIKRDGKVWSVTLTDHKMAYRGGTRTLYFGPQAQTILRPWLMERPIGSYLFSPRHAQQERAAAAPTHRRSDQVPSPTKSERTIGDRYTRPAYGHAIARACLLARIPVWSPNQLRHLAATRIRQEFGLEAAQVSLGHAQADVTQVYAETNRGRAVQVFERIG